MPLDATTLQKLKDALGDAGAELYTSIAATTAADVSEIDKLKSSGQTSATKLGELQAETKRLKGELDQAKSDLENASSDEALKNMTAERDRAVAAATEHKDALQQLNQQVKTDKLTRALRRELFSGERASIDESRQDAAMKLLGVPEGVDFDDAGKLVGHVDKLKTFQEANAFLFETKAAPNQGPGNGGDPPPKPGGGPEKTGYDRGRERALAAMQSNAPVRSGAPAA